ncbi:unnamed protein product [Cochlearia groenlandica]
MYQKETLQELSSLWTEAVREREEANQRLQHSIIELSQLQYSLLINTMFLSDQEQYYYSQAAIEEETNNNNNLQNVNHNHFSENSTSRFSYAPPLDFESVVLEMVGGGGALPENGKFVEAVKTAGKSLESLFITGSVPKWRNSPVQVSNQRPVMSNYNRYLNTIYGVYDGLELGSGVLNRSFPCKKARFKFDVLNFSH